MFKKQMVALAVGSFALAFLLGKPLEVRAETKVLQTTRRAEGIKSRVKIDDEIELINAEVDQETGTRFSYFWIWSAGARMISEGNTPNICSRHGSEVPVIGEVPTTIDLTNDSEVQKIIEKAKNYAFKMCPDLGKEIPYSQETRDSHKTRQGIRISLYSEKFDKSRIEKDSPVYASFNPYVDSTYNRPTTYKNQIKEEAQQKIQQEEQRQKDEEIRKQRITADATRLAREKEQEVIRQAAHLAEEKSQQEKEQQEKQRIATRRDAFVKNHGVQAWPDANALRANPFVYQGKTIAMVVRFEQMSSVTEGLFEMGSMNILIISDIPNGVFTSPRWVILAGTVVGKKEVQLPLLGKVTIPHIKYVGAQNCPDQQCNGMGNK